MNLSQRLIFLATFLLYVGVVTAQEKKFTVSGHVTDKASGEDLIGTTIYVRELKTGTSANAYGFYSITLPQGSYHLEYSFVGSASREVTIVLDKDVKMDVQLDDNANELEEVVVTAERRDANVSKAEMSVSHLSMQTIQRIPVLMGETDVIKAIQLLPGVQATSEGSSGFSVRGGGYDQNLILLDEATVYNASHLMGFFSVFNNDAIKDVKLYKGDIPANFGGRLSSLLDIRSKDGNNQRFSATGGIGTIASRLTLEGPIASDRASFIVSGRRTYADIFMKLSSNEDVRESTLYFYDMNAKLNYRINDNNRVFAAGYFGRDNFGSKTIGMGYGNQTFTLRWNHTFSPRLFSNFTAVGGFYDYQLRSTEGQTGFKWKSMMRDYGFKSDFSWFASPRNHLKFGYHLTYHWFSPEEIRGADNSIVKTSTEPKKYALEHALYVSNETTVGEQLTLKYGLRYIIFQNISNGAAINYLSDYMVTESKTFRKGEFYNNQQRLEPRLGVTYRINSVQSVKASYSRTSQFIQLASNSAAGSPLDVWFQASQNVKPQLCDQFAVGYFRNFADDMYEASAEVYYKNMQDVVDFKDHAQLLLNSDLEQELRFGKGTSYGVELMLRKNRGHLTGWVSYTYSASWRQIDGINGGKRYRSPFDKPNNISVVVNYELSRKWMVSANWVYASGTPVTYPTGRFLVENNYVPIYSGRNEFRYPAYHRLDLSATWKLSKPGKRLQQELNFSLYNAYGRKNPWTIQFKQEAEQPDVSYAEKVYLFTFVPSVTWNFKF